MSANLPPGTRDSDLPRDGEESPYLRVAADAARLRLKRVEQTASIRGDREITVEEVEAAIDAASGLAAIGAECATLIAANCANRHEATACMGFCRAFLDLHHWPACGAEPGIERLRR